MWLKLSLAFCCLWLCSATYKLSQYPGYELIEITPQNDGQVKYLSDLQHHTTVPLDFWEEPHRPGKLVTVFVAPEHLKGLKMKLTSRRIPFAVSARDINAELRAEWLRLSTKTTRAFNFDDYNNYDDTMAELDAMASRCPAGYDCTTDTIGFSIFNRPLRRLTIRKQGDHPERRAIWIDSNIHAREWLSSATTMNIFNRIIAQDPSDTQALSVLEYYDWYYVPIMNPDGYVETWEGYRMHRKNMRDHPDSSCTGTDLNRNYDFKWGEPGASSEECSDTFRGASAASEPETQAVQDAVLAIDQTIEAFWSVHTVGPYLLAPFGNYSWPQPDEVREDLSEVTNKTCDAIEATYNTVWDCGNSALVLYATSGTTSDWAYGAAGIKYSWTPELRGPGFDPGPEAIDPSRIEVFNGLKAMISAIQQRRALKGN